MNEPVNVLLIEDNPGDARLVREELKDVPSRVDIHLEWVDCLESGLERLAQNHIRAVLLDLSLPDSEGLNTLGAVLEQAPHLPVIVMTGQTDEEVGTRAVQAGAQDYLIKGQVDGRLLTRAIQYAMQRKQAEIQLADALEFNEHMLRSSPVGIVTYRLTGECLSANECAARIVGATVDQLKSQNFREIASWRSSGLLEMAEKTIATREETAADVQMTTTFGKAVWLRAQFVLFRSAEELLMLTVVDITERKSAESALAAQEQFTRETLDALTANIAILDDTGTIVAVNRSWREFAQANGMSAQRVSEGINYLTVCETATGPSAREASDMAAGIRAVMRGEKQSFTLEYPCHSPNEKRWFIARVTKFQEGPMRVVVAHEYITERKLAEEALRESEENYRQLFEAESDAIVLVDNETGQILQANQAACALYGYSLKQLLGIKNTDLSAEPEQTRQVTLQTPVAPDQVISIPLRLHRRKDGVIFPVEITGRFFMLQGRSVHIAAIRDVTERKHAEAALEASERRFRTWIEHSSDLVTVLDIDGTIHYQSPSSEHLLGYAPDDLLRTSALELLHPEDRELAIARFFEAMQGLEDGTFAECRVRHRDGSWRFLEMVGRTFVDEHGEMMALINSRDITGRKQAEEKIMLQANLLSAVGSATIATNLQGQVIYWNAAAERLYGWTPEEAIGRVVTELTTSEQSQDQAQEIMQYMRAGHAWSGEFMVQRRDGSRFPAFVSNSPFLDSTGNLIGFIGVSNDISQLKQAEAALRASEQRYRDLAENFPNGVVTVYNKELRLVFDAGLELKESGFTAEDFLGKHFTDLAPEETWEIARPHLQAGFEGKVSTYEAQGMDDQYYRVNVAPLYDSSGEIHEILVVSQNITNLKMTELALREKEQLLSEAQRIGQIGSWSLDIATDTIKCSDEMYRLLDVAPEEFRHTTKDFLSLVFPSDRAATAEWLDHIRAGTQATELDFRIFRKNGELRYLHCIGAVNFDREGKPKHFIGTTQDVTERQVAEIQIEQQVRRLTALAEIDRAIISGFDLRYTLGTIISQAISELSVDAADVFLLDHAGDELSYSVGAGFHTKMMETARLQMGEGLAGRAAKERRMIRVADLRETTTDPLFRTFVEQEGFASYIAMPLISKGKVKGVLEVFQRSLLQPYPEWLDFFNTLAGQAAIAVENASLFGHLQATNEELIQAYDATIEGWSRALELHDRETKGHTMRVTDLTLALAQAMQVDEVRLVHMRRGALLHDIGKLGIPDEILLKPGELSPEEREIVRRHPELAHQMLAPIEYLKPALAIPLCHHERWDGTGYPMGLRGEQIPLEARIFAVVDVWDSLQSVRPYRPAWTFEKAREYICDQAGKQFDPQVVDCFLKIIKP